MNAAEILQALTNRSKAAGADTEKLKSVLDDYQVFLKELRSEQSEQLVLRRLEEESRDFGRLITKGHGQILQGRIADGLRALKPILVPEVPEEKPEMPVVEESRGKADSFPQTDSESEPKRARNMPNLGMD